MQERILYNAELVRDVARESLEVEVGYDEAGVQWLDKYIDGQRDAAGDETKDALPSTLGAFLGECIRHTYGGEWVSDAEAGWGVRVNDQLTAFPFAKVKKQLADGDGESVLGFFRTIRAILGGDAGNAAPVRKPWWKIW